VLRSCLSLACPEATHRASWGENLAAFVRIELVMASFLVGAVVMLGRLAVMPTLLPTASENITRCGCCSAAVLRSCDHAAGKTIDTPASSSERPAAEDAAHTWAPSGSFRRRSLIADA
jgi:hypothetical protein